MLQETQPLVSTMFPASCKFYFKSSKAIAMIQLSVELTLSFISTVMCSFSNIMYSVSGDGVTWTSCSNACLTESLNFTTLRFSYGLADRWYCLQDTHVHAYNRRVHANYIRVRTFMMHTYFIFTRWKLMNSYHSFKTCSAFRCLMKFTLKSINHVVEPQSISISNNRYLRKSCVTRGQSTLQ